MIAFESIEKTFLSPGRREVKAVRSLNLTVESGEIHALIGRSGSGKTTALRMVNGLEQPTSGTVSVDGEDVGSCDVYELRRRIGYVIQSGGLFPHMTVSENVGVMARLEGWEKERIRGRVAELLGLVGLPIDTFGDRHPFELSGGQRQRVGVARALALDPGHLLMDEPFGALDPITRQQLRSDTLELFGAMGKTVLLVTHDLSEAFEMADRVSLMDRGQIVQTGTQEELSARPASPFVETFLSTHRHGGQLG